SHLMVHDSHRPNSPPFEPGNGDELAARRRPNRRAVGDLAEAGKVRGAEQLHDLPATQGGSLTSGQEQSRDVSQRGIYRKNSFEIGRNMPQRLQRRQRQRVRLAKRSDGGPAQGRDVPYGAERKRQVPRQAPHIGALAANDLELRRILVDLPQELERLDPHPPRLRQGGTVLSGELVSTLAP